MPPGAEDAYYIPTVGTELATVYEHAARAIDRSLAVGAHGLAGDDGGPRFGIACRDHAVARRQQANIAALLAQAVAFGAVTEDVLPCRRQVGFEFSALLGREFERRHPDAQRGALGGQPAKGRGGRREGGELAEGRAGGTAARRRSGGPRQSAPGPAS